MNAAVDPCTVYSPNEDMGCLSSSIMKFTPKFCTCPKKNNNNNKNMIYTLRVKSYY